MSFAVSSGSEVMRSPASVSLPSTSHRIATYLSSK